MKNNSVKAYSLAALFSALLCLSAWISIPTVIPFTFQTMVVATAGALLGAKKGTLSVLIYLLLGVFGIPVFAGFKSGIGVILGPTGGFTFGFLAFAAITGMLCKKRSGLLGIAASMVVGLGACYIIGSIWYAFIYSKNIESVWAAIMTCVLPFIIPDAIKISVAAVLVKKLKKIIK